MELNDNEMNLKLLQKRLDESDRKEGGDGEDKERNESELTAHLFEVKVGYLCFYKYVCL